MKRRLFWTLLAILPLMIGVSALFHTRFLRHRFENLTQPTQCISAPTVAPDTPVALVATETATMPFLAAAGMNIVSSDSEQVFLRGVNFGNWLLWEGGALGIVNHPEHRLRRMLEERVDPAKVDIFFKAVVAHYIRAGDFGRVRAAGLNLVRLPFHHRYVQENGLTELDAAVSWAHANGVYVILDLHAAPGGQSADYHADADGVARFWTDPRLQEETLRLWETLATRYRNEPAVAGYEVLNEPDVADSAALAGFYQRAIARIRAIDGRHIIFLDGNHFAGDFDIFTPPLAPNVVYVFHHYCETAEQMRARINEQGYLRFMHQYQVPVMCFEFGDYRLTRDFERSGIHWAAWSYKTVREYPCGSLYRLADTAPWNRWLAGVTETARTAERESGTFWPEALAGSTLSTDCRRELAGALGRTSAEELKRMFRVALHKYPADRVELTRLSRLSLNRREELWVDALAAKLRSMEVAEIEALAESLATEHWIADRGTARFLDTRFR
ncbi:MAG: cellulase family glycosylhydrolase [Planctomycetota bacterium]